MNWLKYRPLYFLISLLVILPGIYSLLRFRLNLSVDFTGGSHLEIQTKPQDNSKLEELVKQDFSTAKFNYKEEVAIIELPPINQEQLTTLKEKLAKDFESVNEVSFTTVGPTIGKELLIKTLTALIIAIALILSYVAYAFKDIKFGLAAILAMLHDTLVLLGSFSLFGHFLGVKTDPLFVTAMLTTLSFSVHDTIVVFDRIRELSRKNKTKTFFELSNQAINETMVRSINNSLTIVIMLVCLVILGGETIRWFAVALLIGSISGTYSSPFTAVPLLTILHGKRKNKS